MNGAAPSRLIARLDAAIAAEPNPLQADLLRAERASHLARLGHGDEALADIAALHARHDTRPDARMSCWLAVAEGLASHFKDMGTQAADKLRRAQALSAAAGLKPLQALSAAWLAHLHYLQLDVPALARHVGEALALAAPDHHAARSRASLVVAQGLHFAGRIDLALPWYQRAREHANAEGDEATLSALMHNMAWLRAANIRKSSLTGASQHDEGEHALLAADSTWNFDLMVGATSLNSLVPLLRAQILTVDGGYQEAADLFAANIDLAVRQGMARVRGSFLADLSWCRANLGQLESSRSDAEAAEEGIDPNGKFDSRPFIRSRLVQVFRVLGDPESAARNEREAVREWEDYAVLQNQFLDALQPLGGPPTRLSENR
jgi:hypothetical protein